MVHPKKSVILLKNSVSEFECARVEILFRFQFQAAEGHFTTEALMWNQNTDEVTASGIGSIHPYPHVKPKY